MVSPDTGQSWPTMLKRISFLLPVLTFAVIAGYFLWGLDPRRNPNEVPSPLIDKPVPEFDLPALQGAGVPGFSSDDLVAGKVVLVNVFASWCIPCRAEHPLIMALAADPSIEIYGINYRDKPLDAVRWLAELGNPYKRIGADERGRVGIDWGVYGVPETFVVDRKGKIRYRQVGPLYPYVVEETLRPLLRELSF